MKFHNCETPSEVCEWCDSHPGYAIISITYKYDNYYDEDCTYVIFYEDFSNQRPERITAHNIDPGFAIPSTGTPMPSIQYPSYVNSGNRPEVAEPIC